MNFKTSVLIFLNFFLIDTAFSQTEIKINSKLPISLRFENAPWKNQDESVLIKDSISGRTVKVEMSNKGLPANEFQGFYTITWVDTDMIKPEIFDLQKNKLAYYFKKVENTQRLELFSSGAKATDAYNAFANRDDTKPFVDEGLKLFSQQKFAEAFQAFQKAESLDNSKKYYFLEYGISAFRKDDYPNAQRILTESLNDPQSVNEKNYFLGLSFSKAGDSEKSYDYFQKVVKSEDKTLAPPSAFFSGVKEFKDKKWSEAETSFQYTLDNSTDKEMDKAAEQYLDLIVQYRALEEEMSKKFLLTANLGLSFDTNILNKSTTFLESSSASNLEGFRWNYSVGLLYRPIRREFWNAGVSIGYSDLYSTNTSFAAETDFQDVDPQTVSIAFPFSFRETTDTKTTQWSVSPFYETVNLNSDGVGAREPLVNSIGIKAFHGFSNSKKLGRTSVTQFSYQTDASQVALSDSSTASQLDPSGQRVAITTKQSHMLDAKKNATWAYDVALAYNKAKGTDYTYLKPEAGLSLTQPAFWSSTFSTRLSYAIADYFDHSSKRKDNVINVSLGLSRSLSKSFSFSGQLIQIFNSSNVSDNDYKRSIITAGLDYALNF